MLLQNEFEITINHGNYKHYEDLGYLIKKVKDKKGRWTTPEQTLLVKYEDIPNGSKAKIPVVCDYCGQIVYREKCRYVNSHKVIETDCCSDRVCINKKSLDIKNIKYGTTSPAKIAEITGGPIGRHVKYIKDDLFEMANKKGYRIISELSDHITLKDRITLMCNIHKNIFETSVECFMKENNQNCYACLSEKSSERQRQCSIEDVIEICKEKNYTLHTDFICNCDDAVYYTCNVHPEYGIQKTTLWGLQHYSQNCKLCHQPRGENHFNWQGGITDDRERDNDSFEYKRWRKSVYKRDNYTCQCCGEKGGDLNAHHIKNYATNKDLRYDKDNGITLCRECHLNNYPDGFHKIYGNYNNTPEQLQEYLDNRRKELGLPRVTLEEIIHNKDKNMM